jgi:hypothetical protein
MVSSREIDQALTREIDQVEGLAACKSAAAAAAAAAAVQQTHLCLFALPVVLFCASFLRDPVSISRDYRLNNSSL